LIAYLNGIGGSSRVRVSDDAGARTWGEHGLGAGHPAVMRLKNSRAIDDAITNVRNQMYACQNALNAHERERRRQVYMQ
jgi:hypothetical protein